MTRERASDFWPSERDVIKIVVDALNQVNDDGENHITITHWTDQVLWRTAQSILNKSAGENGVWHWVGHTRGRNHGKNRLGGEWLYDLSWIIYEEGGSEFALRMPLALECEWLSTEAELLDDLLKLVVSRAEVAVFVHQGDKALEEKVAQQIDAFQADRGSQTFIFARFHKGETDQLTSPDRFEFSRFVPSQGLVALEAK